MRWLATTGLSAMEDILGAFPATCWKTTRMRGARSLHGLTKVGVLLSNRKIDAQTPALTDIAPTIWRVRIEGERMKGNRFFSRAKRCWRD